MLFTNTCLYSSVIIRRCVGDKIYVVYKYLSVQLCNNHDAVSEIKYMLFTNTCLYSSVIIRLSVGDEIYFVYKYLSVQLCNNQTLCPS